MIKKVRCGFTLIEVGLFLAITGMMFIGIVIGVQGSMTQQRFNDSVQNFAEFLKNIYSQTANVESNRFEGGGRSDKAIYGKMITFGEEYNLEFNKNEDKAIFVYTVIANADSDIVSGNVLDSLKAAKANVYQLNNEGKSVLAGIAEQYFPRWMASIQTTKASPYEDFKGTILIVRHPNSGTVFTYALEGTVIEVNKKLKDATSLPDVFANNILNSFEIKSVDFCINPNPKDTYNARRDVRIIEGARNASGVEMISRDDYSEGGNRCK